MSTAISSYEYEITSEAEISAILAHFETDEILNFVDDALSRKYILYPNNPINLITSIESNFSILYYKLPQEQGRINEIREKVYLSVIDKICSYYNLEYINPDQDLYSIAYYLYEFLISGFSQNIVSFFTNYIIKEKDYIYSHIGLIDKKNKDMSSSYNKKIHKDPKLAAINANLEYVVDSISLFDISIDDILDLIYPNPNIRSIISLSIAPRGNLFRDHFVGTINNEYKALYLTNIKFALLRDDSIDTLSLDTLKFLEGE